MKTSLKKLPKSQIEIEFELTAEEFKKHIDAAVLHLKEHIKMDGFRPGQVPQQIVEERAGKENILMEAGDLAVNECYSKFVEDLSAQAGNKLEPIGQPEVNILKIAQGSPFLFKIKVTVLPEVGLPDYKKLAFKIKKREISVSQDDIEDSLNYLKKSRAKFSLLDRPAQEKDFVEIEYENSQITSGKRIKDQFILGEGGFIPGFEKNIVGMKAGEEKEFSMKFPDLPAQAGNSLRKDLAGKETIFKVKMFAVKKVELPEINDEFAKSLGKFENLDSLKASIREEIIEEKIAQEKQRQREEMLEKIAGESKIETPETLVEYEKQRLLEDFKNDITQNLKITFEEYLPSINQTEEQLKETYQKEAEKRLRRFLILREIGKKEEIVVSQEEVEEEINKALKGKTLRQAQGEIDINQFREYTKGMLYNEKVFQRLEMYSSEN